MVHAHLHNAIIRFLDGPFFARRAGPLPPRPIAACGSHTNVHREDKIETRMLLCFVHNIPVVYEARHIVLLK